MSDFSFVKQLPAELTSSRLVLRKPVLAHAASIARLGNNPKIYAMVSVVPSPYTEDLARRWVEEKTRTPEDHAFTILTRDEDVIGIIAFHARTTGVEVGYWLGEPYWGEGYAGEALSLMCEAADAQGVEELHARAMGHNAASRHLLEKHGFEVQRAFRDQCGPHPDVELIHYRRRTKR